MIDNFAIGLTHGLMMIAAILLLFRRDLDKEAPPASTAETTDPAIDRRIRDRKTDAKADAKADGGQADTKFVRRHWGTTPDA
jgi:hypothetical protein